MLSASRAETSKLFKRARELRKSAVETSNPRKRRRMLIEADELDDRAKHNESSVLQGIRCAERLKNTEKSDVRETILSQLTGKKYVPQEVNMDMCNKCNVEYLSDARKNILKCPSCHIVVIDYMSHNDTTGDIQRRSITATSSVQKTSNGVDSGLYRKFLMQYWVDTEDPPERVLSAIVRSQMKNHMYTNEISNTPILNTLREANMNDYIYMSQRIMKHIQGDPIPSYSMDLINRMVSRFEIVIPIFHKSKNGRKKSPNFTAITKAFLILEGEIEEAKKLKFQKTRAVYIRCMSLIRDLCIKAGQEDSTMNWDLKRS